MAWTLKAHVSANAGSGTSITAGPIDCTGADLLVVHYSGQGGGTFTVDDSTGSNTYTPRTQQYHNPMYGQLFDARVGTPPPDLSSVTFTVSGTSLNGTISVQAWSGSASSPFDVEAGASTGTTNPLASGSFTTNDADLLVSGAGGQYSSSFAVSGTSRWTISDQHDYGSGGRPGALAYATQPAAGSENVSWTFSTGTSSTNAVAAYKPASGGGTSTLTAAGTSSASFSGASQNVSALTAAGSSTMAADGSAKATASLTAAGSSTMTADGSAKATASLAAAGDSTMTAAGSSSHGNSLIAVGTSTMSAVGASDVLSKFLSYADSNAIFVSPTVPKTGGAGSGELPWPSFFVRPPNKRPFVKEEVPTNRQRKEPPVDDDDAVILLLLSN